MPLALLQTSLARASSTSWRVDMSGYGRPNPYPRRYGGGLRARTYATRAITQEFNRYRLNTAEGSVKAGEAYAYGNAVGAVWSVNKRLTGAEIPLRMMETLTVYEEILRLRPASDDSDTERRQAVAAKFRALSGQMTIGDIEDICRAVMGASFVQLTKAAPANYMTYMPGGGGAALAALPAATWGQFAPGLPGYEHSTNRCILAVVVQQGILDNGTYAKLKASLQRLLQSSLPAYMTFAIGEGTAGFICNLGICGVTFV